MMASKSIVSTLCVAVLLLNLASAFFVQPQFLFRKALKPLAMAGERDDLRNVAVIGTDWSFESDQMFLISRVNRIFLLQHMSIMERQPLSTL